jgi:hypothetical protein
VARARVYGVMERDDAVGERALAELLSEECSLLSSKHSVGALGVRQTVRVEHDELQASAVTALQHALVEALREVC